MSSLEALPLRGKADVIRPSPPLTWSDPILVLDATTVFAGPNPLPPEGGCCAPALPPGLAIEWSEDPPAEKGLTTASLTKSFRGFSLATMTVSSIGAAGLGLLWILPPVAPTFCCGEAMRPPWDRFGPPRGVADWDWGLRLGRMRMADRGVISRGLSMVCAVREAEAMPVPTLRLPLAASADWGVCCVPGVRVAVGAGS